MAVDQFRNSTWTGRRWRERWRALTADQLFAGSFLLLIGIGTVGLMTLPGLYSGEPLNWLDALFTATSAVCVTGLIVVDTATYFTTWGQAYLLLLIQLGGLGMITFSTLIILALGQRLSLRHEMLATPVPRIDHVRLTRIIIIGTFAVEAVGAALLYIFWAPAMGATGAFFPAVFHSISAFCNAGFSTFSDSLMAFQLAPHVQLVIIVLIISGGIGFLTIEEVYAWRKARGERPRRRRFSLSLHSRLVLFTTAILLSAGWFLFALFEWNITLGDMPPWGRLLNAFFMSVTARTAGFNTIDYAQAADSSNFLTILLMSIGGSPGSTAGGIKTTTFALIGLLAISRLRGLSLTSIWGRSVPEETVQRAVGLFVLAFAIVTIGIFIFTTTEIGRIAHTEVQRGFLLFMFEAVSAFNTVGLSMGITSELTTAGRWTTILLMFIGRVGPLTFAAALAYRKIRGTGFRYAYEEVTIG